MLFGLQNKIVYKRVKIGLNGGVNKSLYSYYGHIWCNRFFAGAERFLSKIIFANCKKSTYLVFVEING